MRDFYFILKPVVFLTGLFTLYYFYGYESNRYLGYGQLNFNWYNFFGLLLLAVHYLSFYSKKVFLPSDFFEFFYSLVVVYPYTILNGIWGRVELNYLLDLGILYMPIVIVNSIKMIRIRYPKISGYSESTAIAMIFAIILVVCVYLIINSPGSASFSLVNSYVRRLEARELYGSGTLISYVSAMVMNSLLPLIVFFGVIKKNYKYVFLAMLFFLLFYYIYGVKAPILYIFLSALLGFSVLRQPIKNFCKGVFSVIIIATVVAHIEFLLTGYSYIEDYVIRRVFYVGSHLIGAYLELVNGSNISFLYGIDTAGLSPSFYVGEVFLSSPGLNANTNTFLYFLVGYGVIGFVMINLWLGVVFSFFDSMSKKSLLFVFLSFMYALLIIEQSATTAFVSSGIGLLTVLFYLSNLRKV